MQILRMLRDEFTEHRAMRAKYYRALRRTSPAKARLLFRRMKAAEARLENALQKNLMELPHASG